MVDASLLLDVVVAVSIALGALFAIAELRDISRDRKTQLVMSIWSTFISSDFAEAHSKIEHSQAKDLKELMESCSTADLLKVGYFYEGLGLLVEKKLIDPETVLEMSYSRIIWAKLKPWMDEEKRTIGTLAGEHFEYLANLDTEYKKRRYAELKGV